MKLLTSSMLNAYYHEAVAVVQLSAYTRPLVFWSNTCKMIWEQGGCLFIRAYAVERSPSFHSVTLVIPAVGFAYHTCHHIVGSSSRWGLVRASAQHRLAK